MKHWLTFCTLLTLSILAWATPPPRSVDRSILVPGGKYVPFVPQKNIKKNIKNEETQTPVVVDPFWMDRYLVTNEDFLNFIRHKPEWRKSKIKRVFADPGYLTNWKTDFSFKPLKANSPVTQISWFAAQAYCASQIKKLPTTNQWEYALTDQGRDQQNVKDKIIAWYGKPHTRSLGPVGQGSANGFGIYDLTGLTWEWTEDFKDELIGPESRDSTGKDNNFFCAGGSQITSDQKNYAAFMRFSFRSSLKASYTTGDLGFRCAKDTL